MLSTSKLQTVVGLICCYSVEMLQRAKERILNCLHSLSGSDEGRKTREWKWKSCVDLSYSLE